MLQTIGQTLTPSSAVLSPDSTTIAWAVRTHDGAELHLTSLADPTIDQILPPAKPGCLNSNPVWSPDGASITFESACPREGIQIYLWSKKSGDIKQLTHLTGALNDITWSPDGKQIGFLFVENATRTAGALAAMKPWSGIVGEDGLEVQRVATVDVATSTIAQVTPANLHIFEFDWSPDSTRIAFVAAAPPGEHNWWIAELYTQSVLPQHVEVPPSPNANNWANSLIYDPPYAILNPNTIAGPLHGMQIALPRWSPDGKQIAFIGGLMSDQGNTGGDIYLIPSAGGPPKDVTPNRSATPAWFAWLNPTALRIVEHAGGNMHLTDYNLATSADSATINLTLPETLGSGRYVAGISISHDGQIAVIRSSFDNPPEVWAGSPSHLRQITHLNVAIKPLWGKTESIDWTNEGLHIQGWLMYPTHYDPSKKYPLIVFIHGGPSNKTTPRWPTVTYGGVPFSGLGYFVFMPNPRGSYGQGEAFTRANIKDFGYGDMRDILTGVDLVEKRVPIDVTREGITGWSYGGYMTMFAVTQTHRFRAAVAGAGISNYQSYYGQNSIDQWLIPFFGKSVYDDPAVYERSSPITFIKNVKTPTLMVVGDRDGECPTPQSFEFWHALRDLGVKTQLVVYPNEGHAFQDPIHRQDVMERALDWFQKNMPAAPTP